MPRWLYRYPDLKKQPADTSLFCPCTLEVTDSHGNVNVMHDPGDLKEVRRCWSLLGPGSPVGVLACSRRKRRPVGKCDSATDNVWGCWWDVHTGNPFCQAGRGAWCGAESVGRKVQDRQCCGVGGGKHLRVEEEAEEGSWAVGMDGKVEDQVIVCGAHTYCARGWRRQAFESAGSRVRKLGGGHWMAKQRTRSLCARRDMASVSSLSSCAVSLRLPRLLPLHPRSSFPHMKTRYCTPPSCMR